MVFKSTNIDFVPNGLELSTWKASGKGAKITLAKTRQEKGGMGYSGRTAIDAFQHKHYFSLYRVEPRWYVSEKNAENKRTIRENVRSESSKNWGWQGHIEVQGQKNIYFSKTMEGLFDFRTPGISLAARSQPASSAPDRK